MAAPSLVTLPNFSRLSERVWRVLGLNPGKFTLQGTNTYLVGTGAKKYLIDSGQGEAGYVPLLEQSLKAISPEAYISDIIVTHAHPDHFGGLKDILQSSLNKKGEIRIHKYPGAPMRLSEEQRVMPADLAVLPLKDSQVFEIDDQTTLQVVHTPGHTSDHCAFLLKEEQGLFTADCVLGHGTAVFEDLYTYLNGLRRLITLNPQRLYPGHGEVIEQGVKKIEEYIKHREEREQQLIELLKKPQDGGRKQWTPLEICSHIYKDYPENLHLPAARGIILNLQKLEKEGRAKMEGGSSDIANPADLLNKEWAWVNSNL
ncbi:beta-lactamase-like protein [Syncephalastrum racemosum]|uniref:Beta-lactamase-like protein n=1 Tax=Syncephalastrum racemosum TaxID=13706 RepID=A0A1X2HEM1_SYNRA|nr:beta-lactamase-like protein [Syncephalastrum racemosum]